MTCEQYFGIYWGIYCLLCARHSSIGYPWKVWPAFMVMSHVSRSKAKMLQKLKEAKIIADIGAGSRGKRWV